MFFFFANVIWNLKRTDWKFLIDRQIYMGTYIHTYLLTSCYSNTLTYWGNKNYSEAMPICMRMQKTRNPIKVHRLKWFWSASIVVVSWLENDRRRERVKQLKKDKTKQNLHLYYCICILSLLFLCWLFSLHPLCWCIGAFAQIIFSHSKAETKKHVCNKKQSKHSNVELFFLHYFEMFCCFFSVATKTTNWIVISIVDMPPLSQWDHRRRNVFILYLKSNNVSNTINSLRERLVGKIPQFWLEKIYIFRIELMF